MLTCFFVCKITKIVFFEDNQWSCSIFFTKMMWTSGRKKSYAPMEFTPKQLFCKSGKRLKVMLYCTCKQSWARDNTTAIMWQCFQVKNCCVWHYLYFGSIRCDYSILTQRLNIFNIFSCLWISIMLTLGLSGGENFFACPALIVQWSFVLNKKEYPTLTITGAMDIDLSET